MVVWKGTTASVFFLSPPLEFTTTLPSSSSGGAGIWPTSRRCTNLTEAKSSELIREKKSGSRCQSEATPTVRLSPLLVKGKYPFIALFTLWRRQAVTCECLSHNTQEIESAQWDSFCHCTQMDNLQSSGAITSYHMICHFNVIPSDLSGTTDGKWTLANCGKI